MSKGLKYINQFIDDNKNNDNEGQIMNLKY